MVSEEANPLCRVMVQQEGLTINGEERNYNCCKRVRMIKGDWQKRSWNCSGREGDRTNCRKRAGETEEKLELSNQCGEI